jgi:hypothetical protein
MQPPLSLLEVSPADVVDLVLGELQNHQRSGRKNFLVRASVDRINYLFTLVLRASGRTKVALERSLTDLEIYGFKDSDGRTVRRYLSGQTQMAWQTYQRLLLWALSEGWLSPGVFEDLALQSFHQEAAQFAARALLEKTRRQTTAIGLTQADMVDAFDSAYRSKAQERAVATVSRARTNSQFKELAIAFGFELD